MWQSSTKLFHNIRTKLIAAVNNLSLIHRENTNVVDSREHKVFDGRWCHFILIILMNCYSGSLAEGPKTR